MIEKLVLSSGIVIKWQKNDSICPKNKKILSATPIWKSSARPWLRIWKRKLIKTLYPLKFSFFLGGGERAMIEKEIIIVNKHNERFLNFLSHVMINFLFSPNLTLIKMSLPDRIQLIFPLKNCYSIIEKLSRGESYSAISST